MAHCMAGLLEHLEKHRIALSTLTIKLQFIIGVISAVNIDGIYPIGGLFVLAAIEQMA